MTIIASSPTPDQHPTPTCPTWCMAHLGGTDQGSTHHISVDTSVELTGGGPNESGWAHVSIERYDTSAGPAALADVHLDTAGGPMKPTEALRLSVALQRAALDALSESGVDWASTRAWAQDFTARPAVDDCDRHVQGIVADLLAQAEVER